MEEKTKKMEQNNREFDEISPHVWKPEQPGDTVEGEFVQKREKVGANESNAYYLQQDGEQRMVWGTTVIDDRMSYANIGEYIKIEFKGLEKNKKGQDVKIFKILRRRN